jgi:hypothetical protein
MDFCRFTDDDYESFIEFKWFMKKRRENQMSSDKSNGSNDSTNMVQFVSSFEPDCISNVVSPEGVDSPSHHQNLQYSSNFMRFSELR